MTISLRKGKWMHPRRLPTAMSLVAIANLLSVAFGTASAATINQLVDFQTSNQPIWAGSAPTFNTVLHSETFDESLGFNALSSPSIPIIGSLGDYGVQAGVTVDLALGVASRLNNFHLGTVNVSFPVNVQLNYPDQVNAGETFTISSSFAVAPGAGFTSTADQSVLSFGTTPAHVDVTATAKACIVSCLIDETLPIPRLNIPAFDLITQTKDATTINVSVPGFSTTIPGSGIDIDPEQDIAVNPADALFDIAVAETTNISGKINAPDLSQSGSPTVSGALSGTTTDVFTDIKVDLDSFLSPPALPLGFGPFTASGITVGADIFDASFVAQLIAQQTLEFLGTPMVSLDLGTLGTVDLALGDSVDITAPTDVDELQITPTYILDNVFNNTTDLAAAKRTEVTVGAINLFFPSQTVWPGGCVLPDPIFGGCVIDTDPIVVGPFTFNESIFGPETVPDELFDVLHDLSISTGTCATNPQVCVGLNLLRPDSNSQRFQDQQSFAFPVFAGSNFGISVVSDAEPEPSSVPTPSSIGLILLGLVMVAATKRRVSRSPHA